MLRVNPVDMNFWSDDKFLQESCIGYNGGAFFKSAIVCERTEQSVEEDGQDIVM